MNKKEIDIFANKIVGRRFSFFSALSEYEPNSVQRETERQKLAVLLDLLFEFDNETIEEVIKRVEELKIKFDEDK